MSQKTKSAAVLHLETVAQQKLEDMLAACPKCQTKQPLINGLYQKPSFGGKEKPENTVKICASCNFDHYQYCVTLEKAGKIPDKKADSNVWKLLFEEGFIPAPMPELHGEALIIARLKVLVTSRIQQMLDKQRDEARYRKMSKELDTLYPIQYTKLFKKADDFFSEGKEPSWLSFFMAESKDSAVRKAAIEKEIEHLLSYLPIWTKFAEKIPGLGVWLAGYLIATIGDPTRFKQTSHLWGYAGLRLDQKSNKAQGKKPFRDKGNGNQLDYSPMLKMVLVELLPEVMIKMKGKFPDSPYAQLIEQLIQKEEKKAINANPARCLISGCEETEIINLGYEDKENGKKVFKGYCCAKTHGKATEHKFLNPAHRFRRVKRELGKKIIADLYHVWLHFRGETPALETNQRIMYYLVQK